LDAMKHISEILAGIRDSIDEVETAFHNFVNASPQHREYHDEQEGMVRYYLDRAFLELRLLLEVKTIMQMLQTLAADHQLATSDFMKAATNPWGEPYSFWAERLRQYISAVDMTFGTATPSTVTKELVDILRATVYSITDVKCFSSPPADESEVHSRIEAVLRCVFPNLRHKPAIGKPIKNFEPDTGLPSVRTLIEYKFVATSADVNRTVRNGKNTS
jgi:hypothetical protein